MRTFVVRVYGSERSTQPEDGRLTGMVEEISTGVQAMFYDAGELVAILDRPQRETPGVSSPGGRETPCAPTTPPRNHSTSK
jgi:hypothetical protein